MTNAYATLAAHGERHWATPLLEVNDRERPASTDRSASKAEQVLDRTTPTSSPTRCRASWTTGRHGGRPRRTPSPARPGTAQDNVDAWFCGYTAAARDLCVGRLPAGRDAAGRTSRASPPVYGGTIPAAIWHDFMTRRDGGPATPIAFHDAVVRGHATSGPDDAGAVARPLAGRDAEPDRAPSPTDEPEPDRATEPDRARPRADAPGRLADGDWAGRLRAALGPARLRAAMSIGSVAVIVVPRPGVERTTNVPLASSTRSRIDARPTRPVRR